MPISDVTPQSIRKVAADARTRNEVCRLPPAPNASPQPRMVSCIAPILSPSHRGASVNAPLGISADSGSPACGQRWAFPRLMSLGSLVFFVSRGVSGSPSMSASASAGAQPSASASSSGKRRAFRSVQAAREKLASKSGNKPEFEYELLAMFVRNELSAAIATPLLAIIVAMGAMFWAPSRELLVWLATVFVAKGILVTLCRQFAKAPRDDAETHTWRAKVSAAEFLYGVCWASVAFISPAVQSEAAHTFIFATLIVVISMRVLFASTVKSIVYAGTLPMTAAIVLRFVLLDNPFYWAIGAMAVGADIYFIWLMKGLNATVVAMLEFRGEKDALIAELEQAKANSDEARFRAEEANLAKSRFLATMGHELRTPLNAILGFSEIMRAEILGPHANPTYKEYAADIHQSGQHLLNLINEILDISRIEAGRYELREAPLDLAHVVENCQRLLRLRAENKGLKLVEP